MWYRTGTIALTNGSSTVVGTGTAWRVNVAVGEALAAPNGKLYEIAAVNSDTMLTLAEYYGGSTASSQPYAILPSQSYARDLAAQVYALVTNYATFYSQGGAATAAIQKVAQQLLPYDIHGLIFSPLPSNSNILTWTAGAITWTTVTGADNTVSVYANTAGITYSGSPIYVYFDGSALLKTTTDRSQARGINAYAGTGNQMMAAFHGNGVVITVWGGVNIHGDIIETATIRGDRIVAGEITAAHFAANQLLINQDMQVGSGTQQVHVYQTSPAAAPYVGHPCILVGDPSNATAKSALYLGMDDGALSSGVPVPAMMFTGGTGNLRMKIGKLTSTQYGLRVLSNTGVTLLDTTDDLNSLWPNDFSVNGDVSNWADKTVLGRRSASLSGYASNYALSLSDGWLTDVTLSSTANGNTLVYNSTSAKWENAAPFSRATTATTIGSAGSAAALPSAPLGYISTVVAGVTVKIPYYNAG